MPSQVLLKARKEIVGLHKEIKQRDNTIERQKVEHTHYVQVVGDLKDRLRKALSATGAVHGKAASAALAEVESIDPTQQQFNRALDEAADAKRLLLDERMKLETIRLEFETLQVQAAELREKVPLPPPPVHPHFTFCLPS